MDNGIVTPNMLMDIFISLQIKAQKEGTLTWAKIQESAEELFKMATEAKVNSERN